MKLIDLLVQELPKTGGWPEGIKEIDQDYDGQLRYDYGFGPLISVLADNHRKIFEPLRKAKEELFVRHHQYEAALAASKQTEWNGEGLPPIGCICEALAPSRKGGPWSWQRVKVVEAGIHGAEKECLVYNIETTRPSWVDDLRPIRTEAERKRENAIEALRLDEARTGVFITEDEAKAIYDAIAAGEIPGVKLEK